VQILNDPWPWWGTLRGQMTVADLIASGTLSPEVAASLWWVIDHGASVFVAAGPPAAGKSTVANALLEFLSDDAKVYVTAGSKDQLDIPTAPGPVYLLVNELSAHMPVYLFGGAAQRAFGLLHTGVRLLGTLHARSAAEAVRVMCDEAEVARTEVMTPFVFVIISAGWSDQRVVRRVVELGLLAPTGVLTILTTAGPHGLILSPTGVDALAAWTRLAVAVIQSGIDAHVAALTASAPRS
jgi:type IV secretory pathway ATPase VirB11/archaellum biosynthesis ATPase